MGYHAVPGCTWLYLAVLGSTCCTWLYQAVPGCAWLYLAVLGCTWLYLALLGFTWLFLAVLGNTYQKGEKSACLTKCGNILDQKFYFDMIFITFRASCGGLFFFQKAAQNELLSGSVSRFI